MRGLDDSALIAVVIYPDVEPIDVGGTIGVIRTRLAMLLRHRHGADTASRPTTR